MNLDSGSGAAIEKTAQAKGVKVIDYDRLTLKGSAAYYVSFNNVTVGELQGKGLVKCLTQSGAIKKKPVVLTDKEGNDTIAIRSMMHLSIGYDHRVIDGAVADQFMDEVKKFLQNSDEILGRAHNALAAQ